MKTKTSSDIDKKELTELEKMLIRGSHLTGQHYKDKYWETIVKGLVLDIFIWHKKKIKSLIKEKLERVRLEAESYDMLPDKIKLDKVDAFKQGQIDGYNQAVKQQTKLAKEIYE